MTAKERHAEAIRLFLKNRDPEKLPQPCDDVGCGFCNNWYSGNIHERMKARARRRDELLKQAA